MAPSGPGLPLFTLPAGSHQAWCQLPGSPPNTRPLLAQQRALEHQAGRRLAAQLLAQAGAHHSTVGQGAWGEPLWPTGWVGSISHEAGRVAVAVASTTHLAGLGIDVLPVLPAAVAAELVGSVFHSDDLAWLDPIHTATPKSSKPSCQGPDPLLATVVLAAKEALFKALPPTVQAGLDWREVRCVALHAGQVTLALPRDARHGATGLPARHTGCWQQTPDGWVTAAFWREA